MPPPRHWPRHLAAILIRFYQLTLSFWLGRNCRFIPSCSAYTQEAILRFGIWRGGWLGLKRLLRCGPFTKRCSHGHTHGFDPVPNSWQGWRDTK